MAWPSARPVKGAGGPLTSLGLGAPTVRRKGNAAAITGRSQAARAGELRDQTSFLKRAHIPFAARAFAGEARGVAAPAAPIASSRIARPSRRVKTLASLTVRVRRKRRVVGPRVAAPSAGRARCRRGAPLAFSGPRSPFMSKAPTVTVALKRVGPLTPRDAAAWTFVPMLSAG